MLEDTVHLICNILSIRSKSLNLVCAQAGRIIQVCKDHRARLRGCPPHHLITQADYASTAPPYGTPSCPSVKHQPRARRMLQPTTTVLLSGASFLAHLVFFQKKTESIVFCFFSLCQMKLPKNSKLLQRTRNRMLKCH